jgi:hypothetical protein
MQKTISKIIILAVILTAALGVNYLFAAWTGPTQAPPDGNTSTPIHVGTTAQVKDGGLSLNALSVFGSGYFQGNVGIGVVEPTEALDIDGGVKVGGTSNTNAGTIRWTGTDFEGYDGSAWVSLTSGDIVVEASDATDCANVGGNWVDAQSICYVPGTSCPSGWSSNANYSSVASKTCNNGCPVDDLGWYSACTVPIHIRKNTGNTCTYYGWYGGLCSNDYSPAAKTCTAPLNEIGCTKN